MFRFTAVARKMNPFSLFMKEMKAKSPSKMTMSSMGRAYRALAPAQRAALQKRADKAVDPLVQRYQAFRSANRSKLASMPAAARQAKLAEMWAAERVRLRAQGIGKSAAKKGSKGAADKKVKKAAKATKAAKSRKS